jgi:hypothetical protein
MTTKEARQAEIASAALAALEKSHPNTTAGQRDRTVAAVLAMPFCDTYQSEGWSKPSASEIEWHVGFAIKSDADLARTVPTVAQYVAHREAEHTAQGREVRGTDRMTWAREHGAMDDDARLAAVPDSPALKAADAKSLKTPAPPAFDPADPNALVRAFAESQEVTYKELIQEHGPGRATAMAQHWYATKDRRVLDERPAAVKAPSSPGKATADAWAATPEAQAMHPAARLSKYRELCGA